MIWQVLLPGVHLHHDRAEQGQRPGEQLQGGFQVSDHIAAVTKLPKKQSATFQIIQSHKYKRI